MLASHIGIGIGFDLQNSIGHFATTLMLFPARFHCRF